MNILAKRPAESGAVTVAVVVILGYFLGVGDVDKTALLPALAAVVGAVPAAITWIVELTRENRVIREGTPPPPHG